MHENKEDIEYVILVAVDTSNGDDSFSGVDASLDELEELAETAGAVVVGRMIQKLPSFNASTYIGSGKIEELAYMILDRGATGIITDDELSPAQMYNLGQALDIKVMDRTMVILDIFAAHARTAEGKLQVELAQLKYRIPRLTGFGKSLSRLGGGIGTRGPGEKKLETDRRHIERRVYDIKEELDSIKKNRETQKKRREKNEIPVVALVGYTNSGKSALMNRILSGTFNEDKKVFEENMLFATLDTYQRRVDIDKNRSFILVDTIGFVSRLPHLLIDAFKSTLEIVTEADLLIHVIDSSYENSDFQASVTEKVLKEIGAGSKEKIKAFNKVDLVGDKETLTLKGTGMDSFFISAKYDIGIDALMEEVKKRIFGDMVRVKLLIPYSRGDVSSFIQDKATVFGIEYKENGTLIDCELKSKDYGRFKEFEVI